jgi:D-glycero-D-manno-heptose 1,7-bisphosphate phosphatase
VTQRAIFVDKDGTLVEDVPYNVDPERIRLVDGARGALVVARRAGFAIVVASNQSGVARGRFELAALDAVEARIRDLVAPVRIDAFVWCPHHIEGSVREFAVACECRKPAPGLLLGAARDLDLDLGASWMVGDILDDVEAGRRAGCRTVLVNGGGENEWRWSLDRVPDAIAPDLASAVDWIVAADAASTRRRERDLELVPS